MTRHRIAQIGENRNPKSPENRPQTRRFLQIRLLQLRRSATPFNGLAVLHGRLVSESSLPQTHSAFGRGALNCRFTWSSGHGAALSLIVVLTGLPRTTPCKPIVRIRRPTVQRATSRPLRRNCRQTFRTP